MDDNVLDRIKQIALSSSVVILFALYAFQRRSHSSEGASGVAGVSVSGSSSGQTTGQTAGNVPAVAYRDGTYTGDAADAIWGNLQVQAVITGGKISDIRFVTYPTHRDRSRLINEDALPVLKKEVIKAQRAEVDDVTGATDSSEAFVQSLESALDQAKA